MRLQAGGIGYRNIPILVFVFSFREIQYAPIFLHHPAFFQIINVGALGMQDGF